MWMRERRGVLKRRGWRSEGARVGGMGGGLEERESSRREQWKRTDGDKGR